MHERDVDRSPFTARLRVGQVTVRRGVVVLKIGLSDEGRPITCTTRWPKVWQTTCALAALRGFALGFDPGGRRDPWPLRHLRAWRGQKWL